MAVLAGAAAPVGPTAQQPMTFDSPGAVLVEGRADGTAGRSEDRVEHAPAAPRLVVREAPDAPLPEVTGQLWATSAVNVRSEPSVDGEQLATLAWAEQVDVTGTTEGDWTQVIWDSQVAWVSSHYLAETEPEPEPEAAAEPEPEASEQTDEATPSGESGVSSASCATSPEIEGYLAANAAATYRAVCAAFPGVASAYGGYRAGDGGDHGTGHALDIMVSGSAGWDIVAYLQAHAGELGITYLIYEQQIWMAGNAAGAWEYMSDRGSPTANHYDHVHVSTA